MLALPPLSAEPIFYITNFPVTNSLINATLTMLGFVIVGFIVKTLLTRQQGTPKGLVNFFEMVVELMLGFVDGVTRDRKKSVKFLPIVGALFLFILVSNWIGLFPGIGSIIANVSVHGELETFPVFRPANTDLNMTLAMAVFAIVTSHVLGIVTIGFFKYANKFIKLGDIYIAVKTLNPTKIFTALIEFMVGLIEIFSEVAKVVSLSLRLFGNVFAGEVLLTVLAGLIAYLLPLPFMALELLVGIVQATVFSMLTLVYLTIATTPVHGHEKSHESIVGSRESIARNAN